MTCERLSDEQLLKLELAVRQGEREIRRRLDALEPRFMKPLEQMSDAEMKDLPEFWALREGLDKLSEQARHYLSEVERRGLKPLSGGA